MKPWPLTGRTEELAALADAIAPNGAYRGAVIVGSAGVGKTRLAYEAATRAADTQTEGPGWAVRRVIGTTTSQSVPMGAFAEWSDGLDGNPLSLVTQVIEAITPTIGSARLLLAVDDAHLLDDLSAFVLLQLVVHNAAAVVATIRSGEPAPDPVTALWKDRHLARLDLQPLSRLQSKQLLQAILSGRISDDCADRLWDMTRGNALFLYHLVTQEQQAARLSDQSGVWRWTGDVEVARSLIDVVELQIGTRTESVHDVVDLVAVAEPLEPDCLAALADRALIEDAESRGLITAASASRAELMCVGHPLYGEVRRARAGQLRLRRLRGRVAAWLAANSPDADPVRLGLLWLDSDLDPDPAVLMRAAEQAVVRLDLVLAERLAQAATAAEAPIESHILHAHLLILLNRPQEAEQVLTRLDRTEISEIAWANLLHLRAANLLWPTARPDESWQLIDSALAAQPSDTLAAHLHTMRAVQLAMAARPAEIPDLMRGVDLSSLAVLPALVGLWALTIAYGDLGDPHRAADCAEHAYRLASTAPEATYQGVGVAEFHVEALAFAGLLSAASDAAERTYRRCLDAPGISRSVATAVQGMAELWRGELRAAVADLGAACADFEAYGDTTGVFYRFVIVYTEALARSGDIPAALRTQGKMHTARHPSFAFIESESLLADAWVAATRGYLTRAGDLARRAAGFCRDHRQYAREVLCLQTAVQFGANDSAVRSRLNELAGLVKGPRASLAARYAHAVDADDAAALTVISTEWQAIGDPLAAADAAAQASTAYAAQGRRGAARTAAERATSIATAQHATSPATRTAAFPLPLTPREREIAVMVADGLSNQQIAEELAASVRTVEGHVYRAFHKLGVADRNELAAVIQASRNPSGRQPEGQTKL